MAKYDDSLRVNIDIITKNIRPKVQEIVGALKEIGKEADKAKEKLASLDKAGVSHSSSEYKICADIPIFFSKGIPLFDRITLSGYAAAENR